MAMEKGESWTLGRIDFVVKELGSLCSLIMRTLMRLALADISQSRHENMPMENPLRLGHFPFKQCLNCCCLIV